VFHRLLYSTRGLRKDELDTSLTVHRRNRPIVYSGRLVIQWHGYEIFPEEQIQVFPSPSVPPSLFPLPPLSLPSLSPSLPLPLPSLGSKTPKIQLGSGSNVNSPCSLVWGGGPSFGTKSTLPLQAVHFHRLITKIRWQ